MERWWETKYQTPSNHDLFQSRTEYDLEVEFWQDHFDKNPMDAHVNEDGEIQFRDTGDELLDKWEEKVAKGETPDLDEAFSEEALEKLSRYYKKKASGKYEDSMSIADVSEKWNKPAAKSMWQNVDTSPTNKPKLPPTFGR